MKNKKYRTGYGLLLWGLIICAHAVPSSGYEQWAQQQKQHDTRLSTTAKALTPPEPAKIVKPQGEAKLESSMPKLSPTQPSLGAPIRVNINRASAQELSAKLDSIGPKKAQAIVDYRQQHGLFKRVEELKNVKGIGEKTFQRNQTRLKLQD